MSRFGPSYISSVNASPTGLAGGSLAGLYPNPDFAPIANVPDSSDWTLQLDGGNWLTVGVASGGFRVLIGGLIIPHGGFITAGEYVPIYANNLALRHVNTAYELIGTFEAPGQDTPGIRYSMVGLGEWGVEVGSGNDPVFGSRMYLKHLAGGGSGTAYVWIESWASGVLTKSRILLTPYGELQFATEGPLASDVPHLALTAKKHSDTCKRFRIADENGVAVWLQHRGFQDGSSGQSSSDTSLQDINTLSLAMGTAKSYRVQVRIFGASGSGGVKFRLKSQGSSATIIGIMQIVNVSTGAVVASSTVADGTSLGVTLAIASFMAIIDVYVVNDVEQALNVSFSKNTTDPGTVSLNGSFLEARDVSGD